MIRRYPFVVIVVLALVLFAGLTHNCIAQASGIVSTSGQIAIVSPPASVLVDSDQADVIHLFLERQRVRLRSSLKLDAAPNRKRLVIPAGTVVDSYFARLEPAGGKDITASASITFNKKILGAISSDRLLDATDPILGLPGTQYETGVASRGLESGDTISFQNTTSASISTDASRPGDELRIITVAGPAAAGQTATSSFETLNFSSLTQEGGTVAMGISPPAFHNAGSSYTQGGFTFTATENPWGPQTLGAWKSGSLNHPAGGTQSTSLTAYYAGTKITVTTAAPFDLISIDLAQWGADQGGGRGSFPVTFHGIRDGNEVATQTFQVRRAARSPVLSSYRFQGFTNLDSFYAIEEGTFATGYGFQMNNIVFHSHAGSPGGGQPTP